jgi:hypothetical protein
VKNFLKIATVFFALTATFHVAHAEEFDDVMMENTEGKMEAAALGQIRFMIEDSEQRTQEIGQIEDEVGTTMDNSNGLLKALGEKEAIASAANNKIKRIKAQVKMHMLEGEAVFTVYDQVTVLHDKVVEQNNAARELVHLPKKY